MDWLAVGFGNASATLLNSYSESPTVLDDVYSAKNKSPRFVGSNVPQFKNEVQSSGDIFYIISELVRSNTPYRDRFIENRMPERGQTLLNRQRLAFGASMPTKADADSAFLAYNSYFSHTAERVEIGVPDVAFGTSYFPYSTLGENFGDLKLPGQQTDAFWPLSADTVTHWKDFAADIRRDLRIAKAMGFSVIRLHYVDLIAKLPEPLQFEYLDFLFNELRHLQLRAMFSTASTYWTPEQIAARVARYKDVIDRVEIENEILIWGIPLDRPQYWSRIYSEVKKAAPNVQIHFTSHLNTGIFDRLEALRVKADAVSAHAYIDALDAIPSGRGFALAVGSYAASRDKVPIYTEWNWRGLTRMTPEARGEIYPPIMENLLATRSIRELYQFQFQQTMCVNPHTRKGIRQYEPLWLSRRPKPEAFKLMNLIGRYSAESSAVHRISADHPVIDLKGDSGSAAFQIEATSSVALKLSMEGPPEVRLEAPGSIAVAPGKPAKVPFEVQLADNAKSGFYHVFLRMESSDGLLRYAWAEIRKPGQPKGASFMLDQPLAVVYGEGAPNIEMEAGYLLAATIESASGRPVKLFSAQDLPADVRASTALILIGSPKTNALSEAPQANWLVLKDYDASVDFALSYWKQAKDSAAARIGLVKRKLAAGADVANLP